MDAGLCAVGSRVRVDVVVMHAASASSRTQIRNAEVVRSWAPWQFESDGCLWCLEIDSKLVGCGEDGCWLVRFASCGWVDMIVAAELGAAGFLNVAALALVDESRFRRLVPAGGQQPNRDSRFAAL